MKKILKGMLLGIVLTVVLMCTAVIGASAANSNDKWIGAWGTAPTEIGIDGYNNITAYVGNVTARTVITPTASGSKLRLRFSNYYGKNPMKITRVTVAKSADGSTIVPSTVKIVTFNEGQPFVTIPGGKEFLSDAVTYDVVAGEKIAISIYLEDFTEVKTMGLSGGDTYLAIGGDYTTREKMDLGTMMDNEELMKYLKMITKSDLDIQLAFSMVKVVPCLASMDVLADESAYSVVVVGDSTVANEFPQYLAQAIHEKNITNVGIVGKGIMGNRLLGEGLGYGSLIFGESLIDRFRRDVLSQTGVKYVVIKIGANDIIHPVCNDIVEKYPDIQQPTWQQICLGYRQLFNLCHDAGIKVVVASITPWKGTTRDYLGTGAKYVRTDEEFKADWQIAKNVNTWLSNTKEHDGYVDLNRYSVNPKDPDAFYPEYTTDGIHPSDTMQKIWGEKFPQSIIGVGKGVAGVRLNKTSALVYLGVKAPLIAEVYPATAENKALIWTSSNESVVKVDSKGMVECVGVGQAVVECTTVDGEYTDSCIITVVARPTSIRLNISKATMYTATTGKLTATVLPANAKDKTVIWSSSNTKVVLVDQTGKVRTVGSGQAVITATTKVGGLKAQCVVTVKPKVQVGEIRLNRVSGAIYKGLGYQLTYTVFPENATFKQVTWTSSDPKVVTVDSNGNIKGVGAGRAVVVCRSVDNPRVTGTFTVTVAVKATGVKLNTTKGNVYEGFYGALKATVLPADATNKSVTWSSSDTSVAKVDANGKITGVKPGTAVITCKTKDGGYTARCTVTVKPVIRITAVKLNRATATMQAGSYGQLYPTVYPSDASIKTLQWTSSNAAIVKVGTDGKVYALKPGKAVITCKTVQGGKTARCTVTVVPVTASAITLNKTAVTLGYGKSYQLSVGFTPSYTTDKRVTWTSSNPKAVSVSSTGVIKGLTPNSTAVITCKSVSGSRVAKCTVKVNPIAVTGVKLSVTSLNLVAGKSQTIFAAVSPSNATNKTVRWSSSDTNIATVNQNGIITAKSKGTVVISCRTNDGGYVASCKVTVSAVSVLGIALDRANFSGNVGSTFSINATIVPENASNKAVRWTTTDASVAVVDQKGNVTCKGKGTCEIRAISVDGNYAECCKVTVK